MLTPLANGAGRLWAGASDAFIRGAFWTGFTAIRIARNVGRWGIGRVRGASYYSGKLGGTGGTIGMGVGAYASCGQGRSWQRCGAGMLLGGAIGRGVGTGVGLIYGFRRGSSKWW